MAAPKKHLIALGIEGSANKIGVGIVREDGEILSNPRHTWVLGGGGSGAGCVGQSRLQRQGQGRIFNPCTLLPRAAPTQLLASHVSAGSSRRRARAFFRERQRCTIRSGRCAWCSRRLQRP